MVETKDICWACLKEHRLVEQKGKPKAVQKGVCLDMQMAQLLVVELAEQWDLEKAIL